MDEKERKNKTPIQEKIVPPNCACHVRDFGSCGRNLDVLNEKISNSIKIGFESLSNSLVECALILSSEDYAKSLVKEREDEKIEKAKKIKKMKEESGKIIDLYKEKLKDKIYSMNISDNKKSDIFNTLIADDPKGKDLLKYTGCEITQSVKKAFCDAVKEVRPEIGVLLNESINFDPMMLALIGPGIKIPSLTLLNLTLGDNEGYKTNPAGTM